MCIRDRYVCALIYLYIIHYRYVYHSLMKMRYANGGKVCQIYCETCFESQSVQGPIINFNLIKPDGQVIGYSVVDRLATVHNIHLRTGCFCNTGACMFHLGLSSERVEQNLKVCVCVCVHSCKTLIGVHSTMHLVHLN